VKSNRHLASFRDPSGYVFKDKNGAYKRIIFPTYFKQYQALRDSGFYKKLIANNLLISHEEISESKNDIILQPEQIPFVAYPYEWSFFQYKEAALLTLKLQKYCLDHGFTLKDASAFNVTFYKGKAVFIDTLSFDFYIEDSPWRAYKQFVMHFFGPLVLAKYHGSSVLGLLQKYIDGIPLELLSSLLPYRTKLNPFLYANIHLLAKVEGKNPKSKNKHKATLTKKAQLKLITALYNHIKGLELNEQTEWGNYYNTINYSEAAFEKKGLIITSWLNTISPKTLVDLGGNDGTFVRRLDCNFNLALVGDIDNTAVDANYRTLKSNKDTRILPFILDILNPAPAIGFGNTERSAFLERITAFSPDVTLALALIHHVTLSGNVPFEMSAKFFASFSKYLIIEFPKREDSWVQYLLNSKDEFKAHFSFYTIANFESLYAEYFNIRECLPIEDTHRVLYFLEKKQCIN